MSDAASGEDVESFRLRARAWLAENMPPERGEPWAHGDPARWPRARELQRRLFDAGFAGLCFPEADAPKYFRPSICSAQCPKRAI